MQHIFVINPTAGRHSAEDSVRRKLQALGERNDCEVYVSTARSDAERFVRARCLKGGPLRFYACGGDGTLNEVVNGAFGFENAAVGVYPSGSGNDYAKCLAERDLLLDVAAQLNGEEQAVDLMRVGDRVAINMVHFGLDSTVAGIMARVRRWPLLGGRNAYISGVVGALLQPLNTLCKVTADGEALNEDKLLLCTLACGQYVGGGYRAAPRSDRADGWMDVCLVKPLPRWKLLGLMSAYRKGEHLEDPRIKPLLVYRRAKQVQLQAGPGFRVSLDGELIRTTEATVELLPLAMRVVLPRRKGET